MSIPGRNRRKVTRVRLHDPNTVSIRFVDAKQVEYEGQIWDYSRYGLGIKLPNNSIHKKLDKIFNITIVAFGNKKFIGNGRIVRIQKDEGYLLLGVYLESEFLDMDFLAEKHSIYLQEDEIKTINLQFSYLYNIKDEFKSFAADFSFGLSTYKKQLDDLDEKFAPEPAALKDFLFQSTLNGIGKQLYMYLDREIETLKKLVSTYSKAEHEKHGFYLRKSLWNLLKHSAFTNRCITKPRGYPGDSVMMEMLYNKAYIGKSIFGKILHIHPVELKAADAVRNRRKLINEELESCLKENLLQGDEFRILSLACGPAWEIQDFLKESEHKHKVSFVLLDQDSEAIDEAKSGIEKIKTDKPFSTHFIQESVRVLLKTKEPSLNYGKFQFIYSMGLFDYLTQPVAQAIIHKLYSMLSPNKGELIIGNYHKTNDSRIYMEYLLDWVLFYRDEEMMMDLVEDLPGKFSTKIGFEPSGCQMFLKIIKES